jgi:hypothetical protein
MMSTLNRILPITETAHQFLVLAAQEQGISVEGYLELLISRTEGLRERYSESYEAFIQTPLVA